ncbi:Mbov_0395 family pilin-like conjugal transfer protein [Patescibacteria group bacterium]
MNITSIKSRLYTVLGSGLAALTGGMALLANPSNAFAEALTEDEFFGGTGKTGADFAGDVGLGQGDLVSTINSVIKTALGFLGIVAVIVILVGGFKWMTAGGNEDKVKSARKVLVSGVIGLVIILAAYALASFVIGALVDATGPAV